MELWDSLLRMASALIVVLGLMALCAAAARRWLGRFGAGPDAPLVRVLGAGSLGSRRELIVVAVAGEVLLLGATAGSLVPLGRIRDPERVARLLGAPTRVPASGEVA